MADKLIRVTLAAGNVIRRRDGVYVTLGSDLLVGIMASQCRGAYPYNDADHSQGTVVLVMDTRPAYYVDSGDPPGATDPVCVARLVKEDFEAVLALFAADGLNVKRQRVTTGSIPLGTSALVTVTWAAAFADANYTVTAEVVDASATSLSLSVVHVESVTAAAVTVRVVNNSATTAITGTLQVVAIHD